MQRLKLFAAMLGCLAVLAGTVFFLSPYAPVVEPVMEIEAVWAIEDARTESDGPLVTYLENGGAPLGYDAEENTFYCTLGLNQGEGWPEIHLTAPGAKGARLVFVDDYSYDYCADAIREGYAYQILCYTDTEFSYAQIVFTGLPIVTLHAQEEIGEADTQVEVSVSSFGHAPVISRGRVHLRGGSSRSYEKRNMKLEFVRSHSSGRSIVELPVFGGISALQMNPMVFDERLIRDRLNWTLYGEMLPAGYDDGFGKRKMAYAEVFLNDRYEGVYLLMESMSEEDELLKTGTSHVLTDSVYRTLPIKFVEERPYMLRPDRETAGYELRYAPPGADGFAALQPYFDMLVEEDDAAFAGLAAACMDIESVVRYEVLMQMLGMTDNVWNNVYLWARADGDGMRYQLAPWDMDMSWGKAWGGQADKLGEELDGWYSFDVADRIIGLNVAGAAELLERRWEEWKCTVFDTGHLAGLIQSYYMELNESGALYRNAMRWGLEPETESYEFIEFAERRAIAMDEAIRIIREDCGKVPAFLNNQDRDMKGVPIR